MSFTPAQSLAVTNSIGIATNVMASAAIFSFYQLATPSVGRAHKNAVLLSAIVAFITWWHYSNLVSPLAALDPRIGFSSAGFAPARFVNWFVTAPLTLWQLSMIIGLGSMRCIRVCLASSAMALISNTAQFGLFGIDGEVMTAQYFMVVFGFIILGYLTYTVFFSASAGFAQSIAQQPEDTRSLVFASFVLTFVSWAMYIVLVAVTSLCESCTNKSGSTVQIVYTFVDILTKPVVGFMVWVVASRLADTRQQNGLLTGDGNDASLSSSVAVDAESGLAAAADQ